MYGLSTSSVCVLAQSQTLAAAVLSTEIRGSKGLHCVLWPKKFWQAANCFILVLYCYLLYCGSIFLWLKK